MKKTYLSLILILVIIGAAIMLWQRHYQKNSQPNIQTVQVAPVMVANIPQYLKAVAHVQIKANKTTLQYHLPGKDIAQIKLSQPVIINLTAHTTHPGIGSVINISALNPQTKTYVVTASIADPKSLLQDKQIVDVSQQVGVLHNQNLVPEQAILAGKDSARLFVIDDGHAFMRKVTLGASFHKFVAITGNVHPDESVIISDLTQLTNGQKVRIVQ